MKEESLGRTVTFVIKTVSKTVSKNTMIGFMLNTANKRREERERKIVLSKYQNTNKRENPN